MPPPVVHCEPQPALALPRAPAAMMSERLQDQGTAGQPWLGHLAEALALRLCMDAPGARLLRQAAPLPHRERWDGNGHPRGLRGEAIPLAERIIAVVEYFGVLTMPGRYRPARADDRALAMLAEQAGTAFDPAVVAVFLAHATELIALRDRILTASAGDRA